MKRRWPRMCSSRLWICEACEKPAPCLCTDWVENRPGISGPSAVEPHRAVVLEQRVEGVVADPGLVPEHVVAEVPDLLQHLAHVVDRAVVGRELDAGEPERALRLVPLGVLHQRVVADLLAQMAPRPRRPSRPRRSCRTGCAPSAGRSGSRRPGPARPGAGTCGCCGRTGPDRRAAARRSSPPCWRCWCRSGRSRSCRRRTPARHASAPRAAGPSWISRSPRSTSALQRSLRKMLSPKCLKKSCPAGDLR